MALSINPAIPVEDTDVDAPPIRNNFAAIKDITDAHANHAGDVNGPHDNTVVARIRGVNVGAVPPSAGQVLKATSATAASWQAESGGGGGTGGSTNNAAALANNQVVLGSGGDGVHTLGPNGAAGTVLKSTGATTAPSWQAESGGGGGGSTNNAAALGNNQVMLGGGTNEAKTLGANGASGTVLTSTGATTAPTWQAGGGGGLGGVTLTGTPASGHTIVATSATAAQWTAPSGGVATAIISTTAAAGNVGHPLGAILVDENTLQMFIFAGGVWNGLNTA